MKIGTRLILGFTLMILITSVVGYFGFLGNRKIYNSFGVITNEVVPTLIILGEINSLSQKLLSETVSFSFIQDEKTSYKKDEDKGEKEEFEEFKLANINLDKRIIELEAIYEKEGKKLLAEIIKSSKTKLYNRALSLICAKKDGKKGAITIELKEKLEEAEEEFEEIIYKVIDWEKGELTKQNNAANKTAKTTLTLIIAISFGGILIAMILGVLISRSISKPLSKFKGATLKIGNGELDTKIDINTKDEIGILASAFNKMTDDLQKSTVSRDYIENVFNSMTDALIVVKPDASIRTVNLATQHILGYHESELIGKHFRTINNSKDSLSTETVIEDIMTNGDVSNIEKAYTTKGGKEIPVLFSGSVMRDKEGQLQGIVCIASDISKIKETEKELIKAKAKAEESDRLKSIFIANMSHEIRTPLNSIIGFSELLDTSEYTNEERMEFTKTIRSSGEHLLSLINNIFEISLINTKGYALQQEEFSLNTLLSEIIYSFQDEILNQGKSDVRIYFYRGLQDGQDIIFTDITRLRQILINLINNAIKFTAKGSIRVQYFVKDKNSLLFHVEDTGIGISEEEKKIIFDRFRQADEGHSRKYGGVGLGLSIVKACVELLGGEIWVNSAKGQGSTFCFTIPYHAISNFDSSKDEKSIASKSNLDKKISKN